MTHPMDNRRRCYYVWVHGKRVLIPGCYGAAQNGIAGCTCPPRDRDDEIRKLQRRVDELETKLAGIDWSRKR